MSTATLLQTELLHSHKEMQPYHRECEFCKDSRTVQSNVEFWSMSAKLKVNLVLTMVQESAKHFFLPWTRIDSSLEYIQIFRAFYLFIYILSIFICILSIFIYILSMQTQITRMLYEQKVNPSIFFQITVTWKALPHKLFAYDSVKDLMDVFKKMKCHRFL